MGQEKPAFQEGALLWDWQMRSLIKAPRGSMEVGDGQERARKVLVLVLSQQHGGEGSAQAQLSPDGQFFQIYPQNDTKALSLSSTHLAYPSPL